VIRDREERLLAFLAEPHSLDEVAAHRFVYRPGDAVGVRRSRSSAAAWRSTSCGCARRGACVEVEPSRSRAR
jgi:hypothetical protein